ncbi:hypothetical protein [Paenibacillus polymyxa]|uniref:Phage protein n=1 Tax=Paenibacillus polymyxa TaxID=1406 RepID=A0ABX2ZBC9_PAEPO|nr:hypothetical protein [Paenibacillus polymyxa]ODA08727.1 hypothetical protein A7312_04810 [Paenibacillus polymyxa]
MEQSELVVELKSLGMPVTYSHFTGTAQKPVPPPPFITYQFAYSSDMIADNQNYVEIGNYQVELYTAKKDLATEKKVQDKLKELGLPYTKLESWLDDEKLFQILYEIQLIGA